MAKVLLLTKIVVFRGLIFFFNFSARKSICVVEWARVHAQTPEQFWIVPRNRNTHKSSQKQKKNVHSRSREVNKCDLFKEEKKDEYHNQFVHTCSSWFRWKIWLYFLFFFEGGCLLHALQNEMSKQLCSAFSRLWPISTKVKWKNRNNVHIMYAQRQWLLVSVLWFNSLWGKIWIFSIECHECSLTHLFCCRME